MTKDTFERSKISILSCLLSFPTISNKDWLSDFGNDKQPRLGSLVSMTSAPESKWYLSWLEKVDLNNGWTKYLLKSVEDHSLCWWENVALNYYDLKRVSDNPQWKWSDKQFKFYDRWRKVCYEWNGAYMVLPKQPVFNGEKVTLGLRTRFNFNSGFKFENEFDCWRKVTMKQMDTFYNKGESYEKT